MPSTSRFTRMGSIPQIGGSRGLSNESLAIETTKYMVRNLEWSGVVFQIATLLVSGMVDPYGRSEQIAVFVIAALHLPVIGLYFFGYGPFARGGRSILIYPIQSVAMNLLLAWLSLPQTYGTNPVCVPGCNYSAPMWLFLAYYPWLPHRPGTIRVVLEIGFLCAYFVLFLILELAANNYLSIAQFQSAGTSLMWLVVSYIIGKAVQKMCVAAAEKQLEVQQRNYTEFFDFLHSHVKAGIATVRVDVDDPRLVREKLDELEEVVGEYRIELLLAQERVPIAALLSERIRTFSKALTVSSPRVGPLTVDRSTGVTIGRALGDLLKNSTMYGAKSASVRATITTDHITVEVEDDGPGFAETTLDDESRSLNRLRRSARSLGGDLTMRSVGKEFGSIMVLRLPLRTSKK